jgi:tetratricopeptide (TPR) repeat protein
MIGNLSAAQRWDWPLSKSHFKRLDQFQRGRYTKASKLVKGNEFKAAAAEWDTFRLEYEDELDDDLLAYVTFMIGYSQHHAKTRGKAIKLYTEVLDYFAEEVWVAAPALYYRGVAHFDNGDTRKGLKDMKALVSNEDYQTHALAAGALRRLADNHWRNKEVEPAIRYWKQVCRDFAKTNRDEVSAARSRVIDHYIRSRNYGALTGWLGKSRETVTSTLYRAYRGFGWDWRNDYAATAKLKKQRAGDIKACWTWAKAQKGLFQAEGGKHLWTYYTRVIEFAAPHLKDRLERNALIDEAIQYLKGLKLDDREWDRRFGWMADRVRDGGD